MSKKKGKKSSKKSTAKKTQSKSVVKEEEPKIETLDEVKIGDFIRIDLTGRIKKTNDLIITTIRELAEKDEFFADKDNLLFEPHMIIVGDSFSIHGLSVSGLSGKLEGMKVGETKGITIDAKDAFGERSPKNMKDYTMKKIKSVEKNPRIGKRITIENRSGVITRVDTRGRVKVDFNHPYAGMDILYEVTIKEKIMDEDTKIDNLIKAKIPLKDPTQITYDRDDKILNIRIPGNLAFSLAQHLPVIKFTLSLDLQKHFEIEQINFIETYGKDIFGGGHDHDHNHDHDENHNKDP